MSEITNAFAVLGVYFALMAVLAVGVEAIVTMFKVPTPWLQGRPSIDDVLNEVEDWLPSAASAQERLGVRITALNKALRNLDEQPLEDDAPLLEIAQKIGRATTEYLQKERERRAVIRMLAIAVGILGAWVFQIDTLRLLAPLSESAQAFWLEALGAGWAHTVGLVLSGLSASAGSSFWHDASARLRSLKKVAEGLPSG